MHARGRRGRGKRETRRKEEGRGEEGKRHGATDGGERARHSTGGGWEEKEQGRRSSTQGEEGRGRAAVCVQGESGRTARGRAERGSLLSPY